MKKRLLSLFLALVMVGSTLSVCASAAGENTGKGTLKCVVKDANGAPVTNAELVI